MSSFDSTSNKGAQLNITDEDEANKAKGESCSQERPSRLTRRCFFSFPKSRICLMIATVLGIVASCVVTVLIITSGSQIDEKVPNFPCDNFYEFSCQLWNKENPRPEGMEKWDVFSVSSRKSSKLVLEILETPFEHNDIDAVTQAKSLYEKCLGYYGKESNHTKRHLSVLELPVVTEAEAEQTKHLPTNEFCSYLVTPLFSSVILHEYIMRKYPDIHQYEKIRTEIQQMFDNIKMVFDSADLPFVSELAKNTKVCIGFPDWILNSTTVQSKYEGFLLDENDSFGMQLLKTNMWTWVQTLTIFIKSSNSTECWKYPSEITFSAESTRTAFPQIPQNTSSILIYIPLEKLEPPFFQLRRSKAMNYGSLGQIIGHELAHAYLGTDWRDYTDKSLKPLAECLRRQYSTFTVNDSVALNAELTLLENLTDNLGLLASYIAYSKLDGTQNSTDNIGGKEALDNGTTQQFEPTGNQTNHSSTTQLTDDQMFFLSFSQTWCASNSRKRMETEMQKSSHAPGMFRVLGTLENSKEFAKSWNCSNESNNRQKSCQSRLAKSMASGT